MIAIVEIAVEFLKSIPGEIWGATIALSGVWIASKNSNKQLKERLTAESHESDTQRKSELRREVYLEGAQSLTKLTSYLATLPDQYPYEEDAFNNPVNEFLGIASKIQLIGEPKTSHLVASVATKYGTVYLQALQHLMPLQEIIREKDLAEGALEAVGDAIEKTMAQMDALTRSGQTSYSVFEPLSNDLDTLFQRSGEIKDQILSLGSKKIEKQQVYMKWLLTKLKEISDITIELSVSLRSELNVETNVNEFRAAYKENQLAIENELENLTTLISSELNKEENGQQL
ncbi:hypothetical protein [Marinobacter sp. bablab_jr008]|uniref:hypothetical protein n=1 Tax=Marinobacter sp. bablab_jr008 TaxID=2755064 RepID=UPI0018F10B2F|nr:hypothetical protein [Marinobacter sp. bablab_jr008]MEC9386975.1 hypothetical protein [Pseudomonadota bacterium]